MSGFSADWLRLREPADAAARSQQVTAFVAAALGQTTGTCVDLGAGTGSNVRYLTPRLPPTERWTLVDDDASLLRRASEQLGSRVQTHAADLRHLDRALFADVALVTASALLDLVSDDWLKRLVSHVSEAEAIVLFALNYDGRIICCPHDRDDNLIRELVNAHQRTDKGFGPALGPAAGGCAAELLRRAGYTVRAARSDWVLGAGEATLQHELLQGWASAACEFAPDQRRVIEAWLGRRLDLLSSVGSEIIVGHVDVGGVMSG
jgi:hypothetical protein